jgi:hypothetical protein
MKTSKLTKRQLNKLDTVLFDIENAADEAEERLKVMGKRDYRTLAVLPPKMRKRFIKAYNKAHGALTMINFEIKAINDWFSDQL